MKRILLVTVSCLLSVISFLSVAAEPRQEPTDRERARTVYIFHQPIVMLQAKFGLTTPEERVLRIRNTLRNFSLQDVFNEFNVQIMSPNFVMQPEGAVVVTEDNWYAAPAEKPENKQRE